VFKLLKLLPLILTVLSPLGFAQDPMKPPAWMQQNQTRTSIDTSKFNLRQIISSKNRSVAVINGKTLIEGQKIDGAKVTKITSQWVKLTHKGRTIKLTMLNDNMTTTTKEYHSEK
jgi:hypothetical protein